jgi:F0F1-type ATP synthase membrane subunit b/b'
VPSRLTELLERIRPAGAPGAAVGAGPGVGPPADVELAGLFVELARIEAEADAVVDRARQRADQIAAEAERSVARVEAGLPERVAVAQAEVAESEDRRREADVAGVVDDAGRIAEQRREAAMARLDDVVGAAIDRIWAIADSDVEDPT